MVKKILKKIATPEIVSYLVFGVLTTLVDWVVYTSMRHEGIDYRMATVVSWFVSVIFAYVTNKLFVFHNYSFRIKYLMKECMAFFTCRISTGIFNILAMMLLVSGMHMNEYLGKALIAVLVVILNYVGSKLFIFHK